MTQPDLLNLLDRASRVDGSARLFSSRAGTEGLFASGRAADADLLDQLLGGLVRELPRARNQPRRVVLTEEGIRFLVRHSSAEQRAGRVRSASPLYQHRILRAWKQVASPAEETVLTECVQELYGDLLDVGADDASSYERDRAMELVLSWSREVDREVKRGLARAMTSLGLKQLGEHGERVTFSGRRHTSEHSLFPGDPVEIVEPGWVLTGDGGETLLQKASVQPVP
ncbi:MAG: hypothetical protein KTR31_41430 [Myxococcales bacterium]|nr:hypothetical protein [Myxococcales bacterium]